MLREFWHYCFERNIVKNRYFFGPGGYCEGGWGKGHRCGAEGSARGGGGTMGEEGTAVPSLPKQICFCGVVSLTRGLLFSRPLLSLGPPTFSTWLGQP